MTNYRITCLGNITPRDKYCNGCHIETNQEEKDCFVPLTIPFTLRNKTDLSIIVSEMKKQKIEISDDELLSEATANYDMLLGRRQ